MRARLETQLFYKCSYLSNYDRDVNTSWTYIQASTSGHHNVTSLRKRGNRDGAVAREVDRIPPMFVGFVSFCCWPSPCSKGFSPGLFDFNPSPKPTLPIPDGRSPVLELSFLPAPHKGWVQPLCGTGRKGSSGTGLRWMRMEDPLENHRRLMWLPRSLIIAFIFFFLFTPR